jgi:hypothetical protein
MLCRVFLLFIPTQGFGGSAAFALGFAASRLQRSGWLSFHFLLRGLKNYAK